MKFRFEDKEVMGVLLLVIICLFVSMIIGSNNHKRRIAELEEIVDRRADTIKECIAEKDRFERIITDIFDGQWDPSMGVLKTFEDEWYGHAIFTFKPLHQSPGAPGIDIGEILDRKIQGE